MRILHACRKHTWQALLLNGLTLLGNVLRISRPTNYGGPSDPWLDPKAACTDIDVLVASIGAQPVGGSAVAAAATAATATSASGLPALPTAAAVAPAAAAPAAASRLIGGASGREAVLAKCASSALRYANIMAPEELLDEVEREGLKEDMLEECRKFGKVEASMLP